MPDLDKRRGLFSCPYFLQPLQGLERIIEKLALGRIGENFSRPFAIKVRLGLRSKCVSQQISLCFHREA
jgi:hypothetical protein